MFSFSSQKQITSRRFTFSKGGGSLRKPEKRGLTGQEQEERGDRAGGCTSLRGCYETSGELELHRTAARTSTLQVCCWRFAFCVAPDPSRWKRQDRGCKVQNIWLRISHRLQLSCDRVGEGEVGRNSTVILIDLNIEDQIDLIPPCRLMKLSRSRTQTLPKNSAFLQSNFIALVS